MIKFFRRIRQKLLTENRFSKYLIYAIGEIILVVIGILIALQINNWNEKKKALETGLQYLSEMRFELEDDVQMFHYFITKLEKNIKNHEAALKTKNINKLPMDSLTMILSPVNLDFKISELTYNKMKNLGISRLTEDDKLNSKITYYYNEIAESLKLSMKFVFEELRKYQDFFLYQQNEMVSDTYKEFPALIDTSVQEDEKLNRLNTIKFIKSIKGRNLIITDLESKRYSLKELKSFLGTTVSLLHQIFNELKKQNSNVKPLKKIPEGYSFKEITIPNQELKKYIGSYELEGIGHIKITFNKNAIHIVFISKNNEVSQKYKLYPYARNKFFIKEIFEQIKFNITNDTVVGLTLQQLDIGEHKKVLHD